MFFCILHEGERLWEYPPEGARKYPTVISSSLEELIWPIFFIILANTLLMLIL